jgi:hypothetical protein
MLILRRLAAVFVGLVFALVLPIAVFLVRIDQTLLSGTFYTDQLRDRGVYEFVVVDLLGSAVRDVLNSPEEVLGSSDAQDFLEDSGLTADQIVEAVHQGLSPEQLRQLVEPAVLGFVQYATAEEDEVQIRFKAGPPVRGLLEGALSLMRSSGSYEWFIDAQVLPAVSEYSGDALSADPEFVARIIRQLITPEWLATTIEEVAVPFVDYVFAESDGFQIRVSISEAQAEVVASEIARGLPGEQVTGLFLTHVLTPTIDDELNSLGELPFGFHPDADDVADLLLAGSSNGSAAPQLSAFADDLGDYLSGGDESFSTQLDFMAMKEAASPALVNLAGDAILQQLELLPECAIQSESSDSVAEANPFVLPSCRPPDVSGEELLDRNFAGVDSLIADAVLGAIPDNVTFTEAELRMETDRIAGDDAFEFIADWRSLVGQGFEYSHLDFRSDLESSGDLEDFDEFRSFFANGIVLSVDNPSPAGFATDISEELEPVREWVDEFRRSGLIAIALAAILLVIAGLLGGNSGPGRLLWASSTLLAVSLPWLLIVWPAFEIGQVAAQELARSELDLTDAGAFTETATLASNYAIDTAFAFAGDFMNGPQLAFGVLAALGVAGAIGALDWRRRQGAQVD